MMNPIQRKSASMALLCSLAVVTTGCATPKNRLYSGDPLPSEKIAVVIAPAASIGQSAGVILLHKIDGQKIESSDWDGSAYAELLPGRHVISVGMLQGTWYGSKFSIDDRDFNLEAEAGHTYELRLKWSTKGGDDRWDPEVIDKTSPVPPPKTTSAQ